MVGEKLLLKMWETLIREGVGSIASPWQIRREGKAHADVRRDEMLLLAQTQLDIQDIKAGKKKMLPDHTLVDTVSLAANDSSDVAINRIEPTLNLSLMSEHMNQEIFTSRTQEEINITRTIMIAEEELMNDPQDAPDEDIDPDWFTRWRDNARKVRSEELQQLWARALAGEVKSPGSYSLRTLEFIKNISQDEALLIAKLAPYVVDGSIYQDERLEEVGIHFGFLLEMDDLGVISGVKGGGLTKQFSSIGKASFESNIINKNKILLITGDANKKFTLNCYKVTRIGQEVCNLGDFGVDQIYLENIGKKIKSQGLKVSIADWLPTSENMGQYINAREL